MAAMVNNVTAVPVVTGGLGTSTQKSEPSAEVNSSAAGGAVSKPAVQEVSPQEQMREQRESQETEAVSEADLGDAVQRINDHMQMIRRDLQFSMDDEHGQLVVKVVDRQTEEVVRQIPSEQALKLSTRLEELRGMLLEAEV